MQLGSHQSTETTSMITNRSASSLPGWRSTNPTVYLPDLAYNLPSLPSIVQFNQSPIRTNLSHLFLPNWPCPSSHSLGRSRWMEYSLQNIFKKYHTVLSHQYNKINSNISLSSRLHDSCDRMPIIFDEQARNTSNQLRLSSESSLSQPTAVPGSRLATTKCKSANLSNQFSPFKQWASSYKPPPTLLTNDEITNPVMQQTFKAPKTTCIRRIDQTNRENRQTDIGNSKSTVLTSHITCTARKRALLAKIPNLIGAYVCRLCGNEFGDPFKLAAHQCPCIVHTDYRCPECEKVFNCPANLASHRRWHKPKRLMSDSLKSRRLYSTSRIGPTADHPYNKNNNNIPMLNLYTQPLNPNGIMQSTRKMTDTTLYQQAPQSSWASMHTSSLISPVPASHCFRPNDPIRLKKKPGFSVADILNDTCMDVNPTGDRTLTSMKETYSVMM